MTGQPAGGAPTIDTPRLRLRGHRREDLDARLAITSDLAVMRFVGGAAQDRAENWTRILRYAGHWALFGWGVFAVEEQASGRFIGEVGLGRFERGFGADFDDAPEAAWILAADAAGRGHAREAAAAAISWHETHVHRARFVCVIDPDNLPSLRLAATLGFVPYRETEYRGRRSILHERLPKAMEAR